MSFANDILDAIEIMVKQVVEDNATKIYTGVCKTIGTSNCVLTINGKDNTVKYYGGVPVVGTVYQVFIPFGNMSAAFIIVPGSGGESGGSGVDSVNGKTGDVVLNAADVGLGNVDNIKQYSASNPPPYPVVSVNGKAGGVNLIASDVGAAPAGYGLGSVGITSLLDANTAKRNGWYIGEGENAVNFPSYTHKFGELFVLTRNNTIEQFAIYQGTICVRYSTDGGTTWSTWEYVNPPMVLGVEYRTTERYLGKPVYVKVVDFGAGANNTEKSVEHGASNATVIDYGGYAESGNGELSVPWMSYSTLSVSSTVIVMTADANYSGYHVYVWIKYYKTTD